jgi:hypothetical protein
MKKQMLALTAITALALSAQAQLFNWTLTTSGSGNPGNGSGQLTLTSGVVTAISGTVNGNAVSLLGVGSLLSNDNRLPFNNGLGMNIASYGVLLISNFEEGGQIWFHDYSTQNLGTFSYTAVPEPSTWVMAGVFGVGAVVTVGMRRRQQANA